MNKSVLTVLYYKFKQYNKLLNIVYLRCAHISFIRPGLGWVPLSLLQRLDFWTFHLIYTATVLYSIFSAPIPFQSDATCSAPCLWYFQRCHMKTGREDNMFFREKVLKLKYLRSHNLHLLGDDQSQETTNRVKTVVQGNCVENKLRITNFGMLDCSQHWLYQSTNLRFCKFPASRRKKSDSDTNLRCTCES